MKLTERKIEKLNVVEGQKDRLFFDDAQRGLAVRVTASGGRSYLAQFTIHGRKHRVPLGACSALSLAQAREAALAIMGDIAHGKNPAVERKEAAARAKTARDRLTLDGLIERWEQLHLSQRRPRYASEATRALRYAFRRYLDRPAEDLDRAAVVRVLDGLTRKPKTEGADNGKAANAPPKGTAIASRTAAYGRAVFSWAVRRGSVQSNPFAALPVLASALKRDRVLTDDELVKVWHAAGATVAPYGQIVRLLILTGQRREEIAGMAWAELSDDLSEWIIPAARTKNGVPHVVPLSKPAREILQDLLPNGPDESGRVLVVLRSRLELVFQGRRGTPYGGWSKSKTSLDKTARVMGWRLHDLRRTLATGLQRLGVRLEVTEAILNHVSGSRAGIVGVYQRHNWATEKRTALDAWADHVRGVTSGRPLAANVIPAFGR